MINLRFLHKYDRETEQEFVKYQFPRDCTAFRYSCILASVYTIVIFIQKFIALPPTAPVGPLVIYYLSMLTGIAAFGFLSYTAIVKPSNYQLYFQTTVSTYVALLLAVDFDVAGVRTLGYELAFLIFVANAGMGLTFLRAFAIDVLFVCSFFILANTFNLQAEGGIYLFLSFFVASTVGFLHERQSRIMFTNLVRLAGETEVRRQTEERLAKSENHYRLLTNNSKDLVSLHKNDERAERIFVSPSCKEILGYEPEELIGKSSFDFMLPEDAKVMRESVHPITMSNRSARKEFRVIKKDGTVIWMESVSSPYVDSHLNTGVFQTISRDITQRKIFEEELKQAKEQTEKDSARLRELMDEKNDLIGLLSHDLRSPVNHIHGLVNLISLSLDDREQLKKYIALIETAIKGQYELLKNVLGMLRVDQLVSEKEPFIVTSVLSLVCAVKKKLEFESKNKNINLSVSIPADLEFKVQPAYLSEAIQNILSNSIKFSEGGKDILIHAGRDSDQVQIVIEDHGIGFDPEKAERLFDRFTREGRKGTNNEASTGLGLYLVRKIVENHKGKVFAYSEGEGKGSTFTIELPMNSR